MKRLLALLALAILPLVPAFAADLSAKDVAAIDKVMAESNAAFLRSDAAGVADTTADRLLAAVGGRAAYIASIEGATKVAQVQGIQVVSHTAEPPTAPVKAGDFIVSVVKEVTVMESHGRKLRNDGFTVVVRPAAGGAWKLIGGAGVAQNPGVIAMLYPGFPKDYKFPPFTNTPM